MAKILEGKYRAKVLPFTFEKVGEKESPMMKANFQPIGQVVDNEVKEEAGLPRVNKAYFLSLEIVTQGKYSGKSKMEALKIELEENYGYKGDFNPVAINEYTATDRFVDIVCRPKAEKNGGEPKFTEVQYVNPIGGKKGTRKPVKELSADEIAAFGKEWNKGVAAPAQDAKTLFAQLTGDAKPNG